MYPLAKYLTQQVKTLVDHTNYFLKDSSSFLNELKDIKFNHNDIMVSFDVDFIYTNIPINDVVEVINCIIDHDTTKHVEIILTSSLSSLRVNSMNRHVAFPWVLFSLPSPQTCSWNILSLRIQLHLNCGQIFGKCFQMLPSYCGLMVVISWIQFFSISTINQDPPNLPWSLKLVVAYPSLTFLSQRNMMVLSLTRFFVRKLTLNSIFMLIPITTHPKHLGFSTRQLLLI